jgi:hypothetical protein
MLGPIGSLQVPHVSTDTREEGATANEIVAELTRNFPERNPVSMRNTVQIQAPRNATMRQRDPSRGGMVYYKR